ncbi:hypothetical protein F5B22DRAFT_642102 [Xylaria bambusicola]|uniref:uncharacterized protein n=1 Tax=Xylaria bambusicola TaxID=326684 RepID=UPI002008911D|nr:uncharacterized protein F5B22DRAFT_642102 [Xylaria bambusicola]KAI0525945.1 hypothetical protein F5B22DRAFT_642102 [Xylaria bambusicola]
MPQGHKDIQQPQWQERPDGYWELIPGDGILYYRGVDERLYRVPRIMDLIGQAGPDIRDQIAHYIMNNIFYNNLGEIVEITGATVTEPVHISNSIDPYSSYGPHWTVQLTNSTLWNNGGRTHLLHFRPQNINYCYFFNRSIIRKGVEKLQGRRLLNRYRKKDGRDPKGGPGGGAGAAGSSSEKDGSKHDGSHQHSQNRGSSSSSGQVYYQSYGSNRCIWGLFRSLERCLLQSVCLFHYYGAVTSTIALFRVK